MSGFETSGNIAFGVLSEEKDESSLMELMFSKFTNEELMGFIENPEDFDPDYPSDVLDELGDAEELYRLFIEKEYPLLEIYTHNQRYGQVDGYAIFILSTHQFIGTGSLEKSEPTEEGIEQLKKFQAEFLPETEIGWKQWTIVSA